MKRPLLLLLLLLLPAASASGDDDTRQAVALFRKNFAPGMMLATREKALNQLAEVADRAVLKSFEWALASGRTQVRKLVLEKDELTEEVKKLEKQIDDIVLRETERARKQGRPPGPVSVPVTLVQGIEKRRRQIVGLQQEIDEEYEIRDLAAGALGSWFGVLAPEDRPKVLRTLERGPLGDRDWIVRAFYARALGHAKGADATRLLLVRLAEERDRRVLPLVVDAIAMQGGDTALPDLVNLLGDERWQVRASVIAALGAIGSPNAISPLIDRLELEDGRLRGDISSALKALTGKDLGIEPGRWRTWWDANREGFVPPNARKPVEPAKPDADPEAKPAGKPGEGPAAKPPDGLGPPPDPGPGEPEAPPEKPEEPGKPAEDETPPAPEPPGEDPPPPAEDSVSFYGIRVLSKRIIFVIDISNSMNMAASARNKERTKVSVAKYELKNALLSLPKDGAFNIVFYHHEVFQWRKGMVKAGSKEKRAAVKFVEDMRADGNTNIYDALKKAFDVVGMGARDKEYELGADTILFLSDGIPNRGDITDPSQILSEVKRWNQLRRVKVHAIGVGQGHDAAFMKALAGSSGGTYVSR